MQNQAKLYKSLSYFNKMGTTLLKIKIMPISTKTNLDEIQKKAEDIIINNKGESPRFEKEPIAFGLTALIAAFAIDESISTDIFEDKLKKIKNVKSTDIIDFRRAIG